MRKAVISLAVLAVCVLGCAAPGPAPEVGNPEVHARIRALTDCGELQREFDVAMVAVDARQPGDAMRTVSTSYAMTADARMRALGCY